jgi:hypothetical protein
MSNSNFKMVSQPISKIYWATQYQITQVTLHMSSPEREGVCDENIGDVPHITNWLCRVELSSTQISR